jgi:hypothetical protein
LLQDHLSVCRLPPDDPLPHPPRSGGGFYSVTRTADEVSVVCAADAVPANSRCQAGWRIFKIEGPFDFAAVGILALVAGPLAHAGVSIFCVSTFDTDYVLVQGQSVDVAARALEAAGHRVTR